MTKIGMQRTTPKRGLKKRLPTLYELDKIFSEKVRTIGRCERCGYTIVFMANSQTHHFIPRAFLNTRYEPDNACSLDLYCHAELQNNARLNEEFFIKLRGKERVEELKKIARTYQKMDREKKLEELRCLK